MFMHGHRRQRIAIIGSGISGLGAAWLLDPHHDVVLFEAEPRPGGHARTVRALGVDVDTGFIVCNRRTYPLFAPLMDHLGVALEPSDMSFSASFGGGSYEYGTFSTRAMFAQPMCLVDAGHWRLIRDILRFFREAPAHHRHDGSIGELLGRLRLGQEFRDRFLLPISGAIWSTPARDMMDFPAGTFVRFFDNHGLLSVKGQPQWLRRRIADAPARFRRERPAVRFRGSASRSAVAGFAGSAAGSSSRTG